MEREFYSFPLQDIIIDESFKNTVPAAEKVERARDFFRTYREVPRTIILNQHNVLIDGYCSYLAAVEAGLDEVPVSFGTVEVIEAIHRKGQRPYMWQVPLYMQGTLRTGSKCLVRTSRGIKRVRVATVLQCDFPQQEPTLRKVVKIL